VGFERIPMLGAITYPITNGFECCSTGARSKGIGIQRTGEGARVNLKVLKKLHTKSKA
jgi:hypothetical protein